MPMSNAQNSDGQSLIVPVYPMENTTITDSSRQVPVVLQQPTTTSVQILEPLKHDFNISVRSILIKMTPDNMSSLTKCCKELPIDTIERLEETIDLVFEKAIEEESFAILCSILCSSMQFVQVSTKDGKTVSFKKLIMSKCQSFFELDKAQRMNSAKELTEINLCKDLKKKKELQLEFEENERRLRKRSVGNCRFMGELFKQKILTPDIILYCIVNLVTKLDEESLECLCILLKTVGKELEQSYDLNDTFDKLTAFTFSDKKSKISSRIQFMIKDVFGLRRDKWIKKDFIILKVQSILNEITPDNIPSITERIKTLPIDTIERLEKTTDLVFEKAIEEESFAILCSILCSAMQFVQVSTKDGKTVSFKKLIISKCQRVFDLYKAQEMDAAKKLTEINLFKDLEKKKEHQLEFEFEENERSLRKRSVGNCQFIGELFNQKILTSNIMLYCIVNLVTKHDEESLECLCILLKTVGKKLDQSYNLNDIFDKLTAFTFSDMKSKISSRIQFMIQEVINLRRLKWISEKQYCLRGGGYKSCCGNENKFNVVQNNTKYKSPNYQIDQSKCPPKWSFTTGKNMTFTSSNLHAVLNDDKKPSTSPHNIMSKKTTELDSEMSNKINMKCKNIVLEYEQVQNLDDIIYSLSEDETSVIRTRHEEFVTSMSIITLDSSPITRTTVAGKIFAELLSKKILSMDAITRGIDAVLKDWNDYLIDYPQFFSYIAAIIAPLLLSQNASFDFNSLKNSCTSIRPDNSSKFFTEVLNKILSFKEMQNIKEQLGGILWIYNKWRTSEYVPLDVFMPNNQINKYFKNDRIGVFILSIAMYDKIKMTDSKPLYDVLHSWISTNISADIIKRPQFVRTLTIAIVIVCFKPDHSYEDFFDHVHVKLLTCFIRSEPLLEPEIQAREVQCLYGIQIMSAALEHPGGMVLRLFHKLYQDSVISKESFELWKKEDEFKAGFDEDLETKTMAVEVLNSFFLSLTASNSDKEETAE